jgi:hypothetical protein
MTPSQWAWVLRGTARQAAPALARVLEDIAARRERKSETPPDPPAREPGEEG